MGRALDLLRAERARINAEMTMQQTLEANRRHACVEAFKPIRELWDEVKDLEVKSHRDPSKREPLSKRLASRPEDLTRLEFWNRGGNYGQEFGCVYGNAGPTYFYKSEIGANKVYMTLDEITRKFISVVANDFVDDKTDLDANLAKKRKKVSE